jgi:hypothetical protein
MDSDGSDEPACGFDYRADGIAPLPEFSSEGLSAAVSFRVVVKFLTGSLVGAAGTFHS